MTTIREPTQDDVNLIVSFIRDTVNATGSEGVILGLSGGLDSAVVAKLSVMALGKDKVAAVSMPSSQAGMKDAESARAFAASLGIEFHLLDIGGIIDRMTEMIPRNDEPMDRGNLSARCRMSILYNMARKNHRLVIGTSNRSELMVGYFTKYGDGACDLMPLHNHYKTQVRRLASLISIPDDIISKPPSAGFWEGQTDEDEMGMTYEALDSILDLIEKKEALERIVASTGYPSQTVAKVMKAVENSEHKRRLPGHP